MDTLCCYVSKPILRHSRITRLLVAHHVCYCCVIVECTLCKKKVHITSLFVFTSFIFNWRLLWNLHPQWLCLPFFSHWFLIEVFKLIINEVILVLMYPNWALVLGWLNMRYIIFERNLANTAMHVHGIRHLHFIFHYRISVDIADVTSTVFVFLPSLFFLHLLYLRLVFYTDFHLRVCRDNIEINIRVKVHFVNLKFFLLKIIVTLSNGYYAFIKFVKYLFFPLLNGVR